MGIQLCFWWIRDLHLPSCEKMYGRDARDRQQLEPWCQKRLVGVEEVFASFGSATVAVNIHGEVLQVAVVVIITLT